MLGWVKFGIGRRFWTRQILTLRYDWACVDARVKGEEAPASLDGGVVMERHYAFNWLIGASDGAEWDEIQPTT